MTLLRLTYGHGWGGKEGKEVLGQQVAVQSEERDSLVRTWARFFTPETRLQLQWRQDLNVVDGTKVRGAQTRLPYMVCTGLGRAATQACQHAPRLQHDRQLDHAAIDLQRGTAC